MDEEITLEEFAPWLALFITLMGGFLRVLLLDSKGMWLDETFSVWLASQSLPTMLQWTATLDPHPPLYYLLLHTWIARFGDTPYDVRLFSALFGTATIPVMYLIGKRLSGAVVGLAAATLLSLSLFNIYFAQEARMYTLLAFNVSVAIYALARLLTDPRSASQPIGSQFRAYLHDWRTLKPLEPKHAGEFGFRDEPRHQWPPLQTIETDLAWLGLIIFSAASLLTHHTAVFFPVAANFFVLGLMLFQRLDKSKAQTALQPPSAGNWVKAQAAILLLWSPWLPAFIQQAARVDREFWLPKPDWDTVTWSLRALLNASAPTQASQFMTWVLCGVLCLGLAYYRKKLSIFWFLAALFFVPILGELVVSIRRPIFFDKTLIWTTIPLLLALAAGIAQFRLRFLMIVALGILGANYIFSDGDYYRFAQKEDWGTAAGYVANFAQSGDLVLFNSNFVVIPFDYYFRAYEDQYSIQVIKQGFPLDLFADGVLEPRMTENDIPALISLLRGHKRVWLVYSHNDYTDPQGLIPQTLAAHMRLAREREFYGGRVQLYETP